MDTKPQGITLHDAVPKTHPATREVLPDDPMELHGIEVPGDPDLMLRLLVEEYARIGWGLKPILQLARDPNYEAFHKLWQLFGEVELGRRIGDILARCGVMRVTTDELPEQLVQIELPN
jgi:hypothetical protein